jgi:phosphoribosyl-ATP pyrophosphohydrolase
MNEAHIKELFENQEFVLSIMELETPEEVQAAFAKEDEEISLEEAQQIFTLLIRCEAEDQELTEEELKSVTGSISERIVLINTLRALKRLRYS